MKLQIESRISPWVRGALEMASGHRTAPEAANELRVALNPSVFFVYLGGSHVALHRETGVQDKGPRVALLTEDQ